MPLNSPMDLYTDGDVPPLFNRTGWRHFADITVDDEAHLLQVYDIIVDLIRELGLDNFPIVEAPDEVLDEDMLDDFAILWPRGASTDV